MTLRRKYPHPAQCIIREGLISQSIQERMVRKRLSARQPTEPNNPPVTDRLEDSHKTD